MARKKETKLVTIFIKKKTYIINNYSASKCKQE